MFHNDGDNIYGYRPWHGLGTMLGDEHLMTSSLMTSRECMVLSKLDWEVRKESIKVVDGTKESDFVTVPKKWCIVRMDVQGDKRVLGVVGSYYEPFQNCEAFSFMDSFIQSGYASYNVAGSLFGGKKVWLLAKLLGNMVVADDLVDKYILISHTHDGIGMIEMLFTPLRLICNNTLSAAVEGFENKIKVRHTKGAFDRLNDSKSFVGITNAYFDNINNVYIEMQRFEMKQDVLRQYFKQLIPDPPGAFTDNCRAVKVRERLTEIFETSKAIKHTSAAGNLWGAYNAITEWVQHEKFVIDDDVENREKRFYKTVFSNCSLRDSAFQAAINILKN